jgi:GH24 family phage-related lysozyme (muramidase)
MIASKQALDIIKKYKGFSAVPYNSPAGDATIGYRHKMHHGPVNDLDEKITWTREFAKFVLEIDKTIASKRGRYESNKRSGRIFKTVV